MKNNLLRSALYLMWMFLLVIIACKKSGNKVEDPSAKPDNDNPAQHAPKFPHGTATGVQTEKQIGPEGGTIAFPDGRMSMTIPAGAVSGQTNFKIAVVSSTLPGTSGPVFRLSPENITFQKPVELTFNYTEEDFAGSAEDFLYLGYQDAEGYWHKIQRTELNKQNKTLKIKTTHFSDWTMLREFLLEVDKDLVSAGEKANIKVTWLDVDNEDNLFDLLMPVTEVLDANVVNWKLHGAGNISNKKNLEAIYTAPETVDTEKEVTVEVTLKGVINKNDPREPGEDGIVILLAPIKIMPGEYFNWEISGEKFAGAGYAASVSNGQIFITGMHQNGSVSIGIKSMEAGTYTFGQDEEGKGGLLVVYSNKGYSSSYEKCDSGEDVFSDGYVNVESIGQVGGFIEGGFSATLYHYEKCEVTAKKARGNFRIRRAGM